MRFKDKVVIVSGGGCSGPGLGTGRSASIKFAQEGGKVVVVDKSQSSAEETVKMIQEKGGEATAICADVTVEADVKGMVEKVQSIYGKIDILFNNVGMAWGADIVDTPEEVWDRAFAVNVKSVFIVAKHVVPVMRKAGGGAIVNHSSHNSINHSPFWAYNAAKAAVNKLTKDMAYEYGRDNIRVNSILTGSVDSPLVHTIFDEKQLAERDEMARKTIPLGRQGKPEEIANCVLFFASDDSSYCNGACLLVDGGFNCR